MSQISELIDKARASGLRRTQALEDLLQRLLQAGRPMTLVELAEGASCDKATTFRLLQRLSDKGMVRRLGLHERAAYFTLLLPNVHRDYLICTDCGSIDAINAPCPVHQLEEEIRQETGFRDLYHELEFFGTCPECVSSKA